MAENRSSWNLRPLGEVLVANAGGTWGTGEASSGVQVLRTNNITEDPTLDLSDARFRIIDPRTLAKLRLQPGDIVMTKSNSIERIGQCAIFPEGEERPYVPSNFCQLIRFDKTLIDPWFGLFWLRTAQTQSLIKAVASGTSASLKNIGAKKLAELQFSFPALPEQRRVAARIRECWARAAEIQELQSRATDEVAGLLPAFLDELEQSSDWPKRALKELVASTRNGRSIKSNGSSGNGRVLTLSAVRSPELDFAAAKTVELDERTAQNYFIHEGDVFVSRSNTRELVGLSAVAPTDGPSNTIYPDLLIQLTPRRDKVVPSYLANALRFSSVRNQIRGFAKGTSQSMVKISGAELREVTVPVPSLEEQKKIATRIEAIRATCHGISKASDLHPDTLVHAILKKAFAGEL